jgi:hypothetical protein
MYTIHAFSEVIPFLKKNTLVVCDLDYTLVHYGKPFIEFINEAKAASQSYGLDAYRAFALDAYHAYRDRHPPIPTDPAGFIHLLMEVLTLGGKLIFVTCRSSEYEPFTRKEFKTLNLNYDFFEIHHIGARCKGKYCKEYLEKNTDRKECLDRNNHDIILIDDYKKNHRSFHALIPGSRTFLFRIREA